MLKRLTDFLCRANYGTTIQGLSDTHVEARNNLEEEIRGLMRLDVVTPARLEEIKLDYLERGISRGKSAMRHGSPFDLYLMRADFETPAELAMSTGAIVPRTGIGPQYRWWAVVGMDGQEVCLGPLESIDPFTAIELYLAQFDVKHLRALGLTDMAEAREQHEQELKAARTAAQAPQSDI